MSIFSDVKLVYQQYFIPTSVEANIDGTTETRISYEYFHWLIISANENNCLVVSILLLFPRYCCKSTDMYRPTDLDDFSQYLRYIFPIGATRIELDLSGEKVSRATMTIVSCVASKTSTEVKIVFHYSGHLKNKVIMELKRENGQVSRSRTLIFGCP